MSVGDLAVREERPPYVRFERRSIEDKAESLRLGRYAAKDVDFVLVTPTYSKDEMVYKYDRWLEITEKNAKDGRINPKWAEMWKDGYNRWRNGQEMPLNGTAIKGWGLISPAQQETLIRMNCMTVEDLAATNDEGMRRIGMGALDLKNKAKNWLQSLNDHGPLSIKVTTLEAENATLKRQVETMMAQVSSLRTLLPTQPVVHLVTEDEITASDLLDEEPPVITRKGAEDYELLNPSPAQRYEAKFGKKPHHKMKEATILKALE